MIAVGDNTISNVEGKAWPGSAAMKRIAALSKEKSWLKDLSTNIAGYKGVDGDIDGLWNCRRGNQIFVFNSTGKPVDKEIEGKSVTVEPCTIWFNEATRARQ